MVIQSGRKLKMGSLEKSLLDFITGFIRKNGYPPTQLEAAKALGVSRKQIQRALIHLEEYGYIERDRMISRGLRLNNSSPQVPIVRIPILGPIAAGLPLPELDPNVGYMTDSGSNAVDIALSLLPSKEKGDGLFALEIHGESMINAMISDGDIVVMRPTTKAQNGEMVAVWLPRDNEATLKYLFDEKDRYRLQPANPRMKPIFIKKSEPLEIKGKVVMVIRRFERLLPASGDDTSREKRQVTTWRLDAAVPDHVQVNKVFDLAVLICPDTVPVLNIEDLPKVKSGNIRPAFDENKSYIQLRVDIQSPECKIHGENPRAIRVYKDVYSPIYFQLTPTSAGLVSILVSVIQELDMLGNTRVRTEALKEIGNVKVEVSSVALDASPTYENSVFVSYAWGGESEQTVNELENAFSERGIYVVRDKKDLKYKGSIKEFERRIGKGQCIILVVSDKYLRSEHCMYELVEIEENRDFRQRVFPIVIADAGIYTAGDRINYIRYWDKKIKQLNKKIKTVDVIMDLDEVTYDLKKFARIRSKFDTLSSLLSDMNALTPEMHATSGFSALIQDIESILFGNRTTAHQETMPYQSS